MSGKHLFLVFTEETCKMTHAFLYALDVHKSGMMIKMILEGAATRKAMNLAEESESFGKLFNRALECKILMGACRTASKGCSNKGDKSQTIDWMLSHNVELLDDMDGHAGITRYLREGYDVICF